MDRHQDHITLAFVSIIKSVQNIFYLFQPVLGISFSLCLVLHGCESLPCPDGCFTETTNHSVKLAVQKPAAGQITSIDALVFNNDLLQRIDCYQRFENNVIQTINVSSTSGEKLLMACANTGFSLYDWRMIYTPEGLKQMKTDLEDEMREFPVMSGVTYFAAGENNTKPSPLKLRRVSAEIVLRSLSSNFTGRAYEGEKLRNIKVYLTNINVTSPIWDETGIPERYINHGRLNFDEVARFNDPSLIYQEIEGEVGKDIITPDIRLWCYPNTCQNEGIGTAFTRLVIQADIQGETWYWPIDINRNEGEGGNGVHRNSVYTYDIVIRRKGSADPDTAISTGDIDIKTDIREWNEKDEYSIPF